MKFNIKMAELEIKKITNNTQPKSVNGQNIEKINIKDYEIGEKLYKCNYGYISFCKKHKTNKIYSLKIIKKSTILDKKIIERHYNEYKNLSLLYHPFIVELKGINTTDPINLYFLLEFVSGGTLKNFIKLNKTLSLNQAKFYLGCLITILDYIHKKNIIHRDIRPENILINHNGYIKLGEFALSKKLEDNFTYSLCGSPEYYSPEMINKTGYNKSIDFWQTGIFLYEMLVGFTPFNDNDPIKIFKNINKGKIIFPKGFDRNTKNIIMSFLKVDVNKRLGCTKKGIFEIIKHPFFKGFDWEKLLHRELESPFNPYSNLFFDFTRYQKLKNNCSEKAEDGIPKERDPFYNWE